MTGRRQNRDLLSFREMPGLRRERFDVRDLGQVFTHIHDQEIAISERFYLGSLT